MPSDPKEPTVSLSVCVCLRERKTFKHILIYKNTKKTNQSKTNKQ